MVAELALTITLMGLPLRYLIGVDNPALVSGTFTLVSYDTTKAYGPNAPVGKYVNLFDEKNTGRYAPYLKDSDTAQQYNEGQIDPRGKGWTRNLDEQFRRALAQGNRVVELDNPDAYAIKDVLGAVDMAKRYGLYVIAKNPLITRGPKPYLAHPNVVAAIVEKGAGSPDRMHDLRCLVNKPSLPVWFVSFGNGREWANVVAREARHYSYMGVTYSGRGEYGSAVDLQKPVVTDRTCFTGKE